MLQDAGHAVSKGSPPAVADVHRPDGVSRDKLDLDPLSLAKLAGAEVASLGARLGQYTLER